MYMSVCLCGDNAGGPSEMYASINELEVDSRRDNYFAGVWGCGVRNLIMTIAIRLCKLNSWFLRKTEIVNYKVAVNIIKTVL